MLAICGVVKVNDYVRGEFNLTTKKWEADVDLSNKLKSYLDNLNAMSRSLVEDDVNNYLKEGPIDSIEITVDSGEASYITVNKEIYNILRKYLLADRRVVRIKFKFYNRLKSTTYVDEYESGDYLIIPVACRTEEEEMRATAWTWECLKVIVSRMYKRNGNNLSNVDALKMLNVNG